MKFSVALCTYNGSEFIKEQLQSIIAQTEPVEEIVICDDASKDDTVAIVQSVLKNTNIKYEIIVNEKSLGVSKNFLKAIHSTTGDYVFTCDQDDIWLNNKVEIFKKYITKSKKLLYFSDGLLVDANVNSLNATLWEAFNLKHIEEQEQYINVIVKKPIVTGAAMCVSRELIDKVEYVPDGILHDEWFSIIAIFEKSIEAINEKTFYYRQHGKNVLGASKRNLFQKFQIWKKNIEKIDTIRKHNFLRVNAMHKVAQGTEYKELVDRGICFWEGMCNLNNISSSKGIIYICKEYLIGNYRLFYTDIRGFIRDFIKFFI